MAFPRWTWQMAPLILAALLIACGGGSGSQDPGPGPDPPPPPPPPWPPPIPLLPPWQEPDCDSISGPPIATLSTDGGITVLRNEDALATGPEARTHSIIPNPLDGGQVIAARGTDVYWSLNAGCSWELLTSAAEPVRLVGQTFPWYVYGIGDRGDTLYVFSDYLFENGHGTFEIPFQALDIAPARLSTVHALASNGSIMRLEFDVFQQDAWQLVGWTPAGSSPRFIAVSPDSTYFGAAHIVVSMESGPLLVTFDSGQTWAVSEGILNGANEVRTGRAHFTNLRDDGDMRDIWVVLERTFVNSDTGDHVHERAIARSTDGGQTFSDAVLGDGDTVVIGDEQFSGQLLFTQLSDSGEVSFTAGGCPDAEPRLYKYRASDDSLTVITWDTGMILGIESVGTVNVIKAAERELTPIYYFGHRAVDTCD